jgi:hypothetical protein
VINEILFHDAVIGTLRLSEAYVKGVGFLVIIHPIVFLLQFEKIRNHRNIKFLYLRHATLLIKFWRKGWESNPPPPGLTEGTTDLKSARTTRSYPLPAFKI